MDFLLNESCLVLSISIFEAPLLKSDWSAMTSSDIIQESILELRRIFQKNSSELVKSRISPEDYFVNLSHEPPTLKYPDVGISRLVVGVCELISNLLLEDTDESKYSIVMIFEYFFLVAPVLFKSQGARFINDTMFMKHFLSYIKSLYHTRPEAQKELGNILVHLDISNPIKDLD